MNILNKPNIVNKNMQLFKEAIVGHSNPAMTRHYTHIGEQAAMDAVKMLPEI